MCPRNRYLSVLLFLITLAIYWSVQGFDFVNYDDSRYVYENQYVTGGLTGENLKWAFTIHGPSMWIPMTWLSHQSAVSVFGLNPSAFHLINAILHAINAALLFLVINRYTGATWRALCVAALFSLHPLHVESVAWITERKDVLSLFFVLLTLLAYRHYSSTPSVGRLVLVCALHAAAVMAKPLAVTVPCVLLLLDVWPLGRVSRNTQTKAVLELTLEKLPLLAISAFASWMTVLCQQSIGAIGSLEQFPLQTRLLNAAVNYATYLRKAILPVDLAPFYPFPSGHSTSTIVIGISLLITISALAILRWRQKAPALMIGWLWFLGTLVPMIGLVQAGSHNIADRYAYLPIIGIYWAVIWEISAICKRIRIPVIAQVTAAAVVLAYFGVQTIAQIGVWQNSRTLFEHTTTVTSDNYLAYNNLALYHRDQGNHSGALRLFHASVQANPNYPEALNNLGMEAAGNGQFTVARDYFLQAIALRPAHTTAQFNLAKAEYDSGNFAAAEHLFKVVTNSKSATAQMFYDFAYILLAQNRESEAVVLLNTAVAMRPDYVDAWSNLGLAQSRIGQIEAARHSYQKALGLSPDHLIANQNLKLLSAPQSAPVNHLQAAHRLQERGELDQAISHYFKALEQTPNNVGVLNDLGVVFGMKNDHVLALDFFNQALKIDPKHVLARQNKAAAEAAIMLTSDSFQ